MCSNHTSLWWVIQTNPWFVGDQIKVYDQVIWIKHISGGYPEGMDRSSTNPNNNKSFCCRQKKYYWRTFIPLGLFSSYIVFARSVWSLNSIIEMIWLAGLVKITYLNWSLPLFYICSNLIGQLIILLWSLLQLWRWREMIGRPSIIPDYRIIHYSEDNIPPHQMILQLF